eukprot:4008935-Pleurochrysis_carterae.AAC.1
MNCPGRERGEGREEEGEEERFTPSADQACERRKRASAYTPVCVCACARARAGRVDDREECARARVWVACERSGRGQVLAALTVRGRRRTCRAWRAPCARIGPCQSS